MPFACLQDKNEISSGVGPCWAFYLTENPFVACRNYCLGCDFAIQELLFINWAKRMRQCRIAAPQGARGQPFAHRRQALRGRTASVSPFAAAVSGTGSMGVAATHQQQQQQQQQQHSQLPISDESKAIGCLLGAMCGNVLGAPHQDDRHFQVVRQRRNGVTDFWRYDIGPHPVQYGHYTGDFSNLLAVAISLVQYGTLDCGAVLTSLVQSYDPDRRRYSMYDKIVMDAVLAGTEPLQIPQLAERYLAEATRRLASSSSDRPEREPHGPCDLGAAARAAPIGFAYRSAGPAALLSAVRSSLEFSHPTPLGLDAAHVVAAATAWLARQQGQQAAGGQQGQRSPQAGVVAGSSGSGDGPGGTSTAGSSSSSSSGGGPEAMLSYLIDEVAVTSDMLGKLRLLRESLFQVDAVTDWRAFYAGPQWHALASLMTRLCFHGFATAGSEFAAVALLALITNWNRPEQAVIVAASFGGHAPATAQVVGALAGALHGREWVPERWWSEVENGEDGGRDVVVEVGKALGALRVDEEGGKRGEQEEGEGMEGEEAGAKVDGEAR
ncbi:hypothetical protein Agub_g13889 [Astrephomene gubernaculifera]|uniref:ADP-ribosylhydrolase ARH3 n=1 Tax=Astrephomene gubernaculifera TaxID=47775 RepID=A0AAD3E0N3_9CHLO|nr:hypothetical protein Agub_g13889 [Astrephomene gubernaculifera]